MIKSNNRKTEYEKDLIGGNDFMKKIICAILGVCLLIPCAAPFAAAANKSTVKETDGAAEGVYETVENAEPFVIIRGMDFNGLKKDAGTDKETSVGVKITFGGIVGALCRAAVAGLKSFSADAAVDVLIDYVYSTMKDYGCDKNGDSADNVTVPLYEKSVANYPELSGEGGNGEEALARTAAKRYGADKVYFFVYDWRLDPTVNAAYLNDLINTALEEHPESKKVNAVCCSMGGIVTLAYMTYYGSDKINSLVSDSSVMYGTDVTSELMLGKVNFDAEAADRYLSFVAPAAAPFVHMLTKIGLTERICGFINSFAEKYKSEIYDRVLLPVYGTMPAIWSIVYNEDYEAAKKFVFDGKEDEYAALIARTDKIQSEIVARRTETLENAMANGMKFSVISNYNRPNICAYESAGLQGDGTLETGPMSFGATVSEVGHELSAEQLAGADEKYVSVDKCINASTAQFADMTWFVRNCRHVGCIYMSEFTHFIFALVESEEQPLCDTLEDYGRFMISDSEEKLYPLTLENIAAIENGAGNSPIC